MNGYHVKDLKSAQYESLVHFVAASSSVMSISVHGMVCPKGFATCLGYFTTVGFRPIKWNEIT